MTNYKENIVNTATQADRLLALIISVVLIAAVLQLPKATAQSVAGINGSMTLSVTSNRPLADMLDKMQALYKAPISLEEVPVQYSGELVTKAVVGLSGPHPYVLPADGTFSVTLDSRDTTAFEAAKSVVEAYAASGLPGTYEVVKTGDRIDVVPLQGRAVSGVMQEVRPVMSQLITFPVAERSVEATVKLMIDQASKAAGVKILVMGQHFPRETMIEMGAQGESFRSIVAKLAYNVEPRIYYRLFYSPGDKAYFLTFANVERTPYGGYPVTTKPAREARPAPPTDNPFFIKTK